MTPAPAADTEDIRKIPRHHPDPAPFFTSVSTFYLFVQSLAKLKMFIFGAAELASPHSVSLGLSSPAHMYRPLPRPPRRIDWWHMGLPGILPSAQISNVSCQAHRAGEVLYSRGAGRLVPVARYYDGGSAPRELVRAVPVPGPAVIPGRA